MMTGVTGVTKKLLTLYGNTSSHLLSPSLRPFQSETFYRVQSQSVKVVAASTSGADGGPDSKGGEEGEGGEGGGESGAPPRRQSITFSRSRGGSELREYVETKVKMHPIWHNEHFWEEAFYMSTREEMAKHFSRRGSVSGAAGGTDTYQLVCFGQLGS